MPHVLIYIWCSHDNLPKSRAPKLVLDSTDALNLGRGKSESKKICAANIPQDPLERVMIPWLDQLILLAKWKVQMFRNVVGSIPHTGFWGHFIPMFSKVKDMASNMYRNRLNEALENLPSILRVKTIVSIMLWTSKNRFLHGHSNLTTHWKYYYPSILFIATVNGFCTMFL